MIRPFVSLVKLAKWVLSPIKKYSKSCYLGSFLTDRYRYIFLHLAGRVESSLFSCTIWMSYPDLKCFTLSTWFGSIKKEINEVPLYSIYNTIYIHTSRMFLIQCHGDLFPIFQLALDWQYQTVHQSSAKDTTTMQSSKVLFSIVFFHPHALEW